MKLECGSGQPNQRRSGIDLGSNEISEAVKVTLQLVPRHAKPIVDSPERQSNFCRSFELDYDKPSLPRNAQQIDYPRSPAANAGTCE